MENERKKTFITPAGNEKRALPGEPVVDFDVGNRYLNDNQLIEAWEPLRVRVESKTASQSLQDEMINRGINYYHGDRYEGVLEIESVEGDGFVISPEDKQYDRASEEISSWSELEWYADAKQILAYLDYHSEEEQKNWDEPAPEDEEWLDAYREMCEEQSYFFPKEYEHLGLHEEFPIDLIEHIEELHERIEGAKAYISSLPQHPDCDWKTGVNAQLNGSEWIRGEDQ